MLDNEVFKEWHEEDFSFHKDIMISFSQCTPDLNMSWAEILRFTSDTAGEDFTKRNMSWSFLMEKGIVFVVSRTTFHAYKMPVADQRITLNTYETAPSGPLSNRYYEIVDSNTKEILVTGVSQWSILDVNERKMLPAKSFTLRPTPTRTVEYEGIAAGRIKTPENIENWGEHQIQYSDLDANGHTNNSKYINFALDILPVEYQSKVFKDIRLNYSKETMLGDKISLMGSINEEEHKIVVIGMVENQNSFECEFSW